MASDKPSPVLLDAVKAQASKLRETKNALDARGKELDTLRAELDARTAALENQAARLKAQRERARAETIERLSVMERGMAERDRKLAKREEELIKLQNERLNSLEAREREMLKISEEMYARQKESAAQHDSFVELQTTLKDELYHLASEREKLAVKEKSLLEAEKYITAALEASGIGMPEESETKSPPPPSTAEMRPPRPPQAQAPPPAPAPSMEPLRDEIFEEETSEAKPRVTRADALEHMTKALETAKRARDVGRNVSEIRKTLKQARAAFEGGDYETATRLARDILRDLEAVPMPR